MNRVLRHIRRAVLLHARDTPTDVQLLESFVTERDEAAFEALLRRHGPMVLGVCRRVLRHAQDAEDAFQATFLVLARKAGSLHSRELLGNWLYGVALRTALKARAMNAKRETTERQAGEATHRELSGDGTSEELLAKLDLALNRLPEKYRIPLVFCELEGKSRKEVARHLGLPEGTLSWRLAYAKKLLARRLAPYGTGAVLTVLSRESASAYLPPFLLKATARAALHVAAGQTLTTGLASAQVVTLTEGVLKAMLLSKLKTMWAVALVFLVGVGAVGLTYRPAAAQPQPARSGDTSPAARTSADDLEELRLEVAALRKGLEATRARVKTLETEVQTLKANRLPLSNEKNFEGRKTTSEANYPIEAQTIIDVYSRVYGLTEKENDPLAEAQSALKRIRANSSDKEAVDALDRALQQLKERQHKTRPPQGATAAPANPARR
jgi:RNA polymerase sigma factor (sigma-70 family)